MPIALDAEYGIYPARPHNGIGAKAFQNETPSVGGLATA